MGPRVLVPASKLEAWYNYTTSTLELNAEGECPADWHNMYFHQESFQGGLKFTLYAYGFYAEKDPVKRKYTYQQNFPIANIHIAAPTGWVLICDQSNPTVGEPVRIEPKYDTPSATTNLIGQTAGGKGSAMVTSLVNKAEKPSVEAMGAPTPITAKGSQSVVAIQNQPFTIKRSFPSNADRVDVAYDKAMLSMVNASFVSPGTLEWIFSPYAVGNTTVDTGITITNGHSPMHYTQATSVTVINPSFTGAVDNVVAAGIQSFVSRVLGANKLVQAKFPDAQLLEVNARGPPPSHFPVAQPSELTRLLCTYTAHDSQGNQGVATIEALTWNDWGNVVWKTGEWFKEVSFDINKCSDILKAGDTMRQHGQNAAIFEATLRHPFYPSGAPNEPCYTFELVDGTAVVGGFSGSYNWYPKTTA